MEEDVLKAMYRTTVLFHNAYAVQDIVVLIVSKKVKQLLPFGPGEYSLLLKIDVELSNL